MTDDIIHVPPQSPRQSPCKIAFLGEAPSNEELLEGKPLVGPSGRIFNAMLRTANLERADYWVGNVFDQKLPVNEVSNWCVTKAEAKAAGFDDEMYYIPGAGVLRPEHRWHLGRLMKELDVVKPTVIVPMGSTALWAMTGQTEIGMFRGNLDLATFPGNYKILPTFHPAHVMRTWKFYSIVVGDFIKAARAADMGPDLVYPEKTLIIEPTLDDIEAYVHDELFFSDLITPDIETGWGQITCIGFAASSTSAICIPFVDFRKPNKSYWPTVKEELVAWDYVKCIMECSIPKLGQNFAAYDAYWLLDKMGIRTMNLLHDTRLLHHALYPELPKSLSFMSGYTMQGPWKHWGRKGEKRDD